MPISQLGQVNVASLNVPQVLIQIVPPQFLTGGVLTNIGGLVGTASWGPVNSLQYFGNYQQYAAIFGPTINRKYDMGGHVIAAALQRAAAFGGIRITDATDTAAAIVIQTNCLTLTAKYTGTYGANIKATISAGAAATTKKIVISCPGITPESFDNIGAGLTANALWLAFANALNNGTSTARGPSALVVATAGVGVTTPANATVSLTGGSDGVTGITGSGATTAMMGIDTVPRTGMYAFRGTPVARFTLCDLDDSTSWSAQAAFALDNGMEAFSATPAGDTLSNATTALSGAGIDTYGISVCFGDYPYFIDTVNNIPLRMVSPAAFKLGLRCALSPEQSSLNKPIYGIAATQSSLQGKTYSMSDLQILALARLDVLTVDLSLSNNYIFRLGINTSSNQVTMGDQYTDMINWLAKSYLKALSPYIGVLIDPDVMRRVKVTLDTFLALAEQLGMIGTFDGSQPYRTIVDSTNNSQGTAALGYLFVTSKVVLKNEIRYLICNLEAGASVIISATPPPQFSF